MRTATRTALACLLCIATAALALAQGGRGSYLTKDGELTEALEIRDLQGGFAGFTGKSYRILENGEWTISSVFQKKVEVLESGKLSKDELAKLAQELAKYDLLGLKNAGRATVNPHVVTITYGKLRAELQLAAGDPIPQPKAGAKMTVETRYGGIVTAVKGMLKGGKKEKGSGDK